MITITEKQKGHDSDIQNPASDYDSDICMEEDLPLSQLLASGMCWHGFGFDFQSSYKILIVQISDASTSKGGDTKGDEYPDYEPFIQSK